jgi:predicted Zn-dependent peptidase
VKSLFKNVSTKKKARKERVMEKQNVPALKIRQKTTDQTPLVMAFRSFGVKDKRNAALSVLLGVLGAGMSSRLFRKLRGEMGACYYVQTYEESHIDHGAATIVTGIDKNRAKEIVQAILAECALLKTQPVEPEELQKVKDYLVSHMYMGLETSDSRANFYGLEEVVRGKAKSPKELEKEIRSVTAKEVMKVAKDIFTNEKMNLAIVGDIADEAPLRQVLKF